MEKVRKYDRVIRLVNKSDKKLLDCNYGLEIATNSGETIQVTKEQCIHELYCENSPLNNYIQTITYSKVVHKDSSRKGEEIIYYTDTKFHSKELELSGICNMLRNGANTVVTPEGVILMYESNVIVATIDCFTEKFILVKEIDPQIKEIEQIEVDYEQGKTFVDCVLNDQTKVKKEVLFTFDFTAKEAPNSAVKVYFM